MKNTKFGEKPVWPILFYQDDYETNNSLCSRKGLGKLGTIYIIIYINLYLAYLHLYDQKLKIFSYYLHTRAKTYNMLL